MIIAASLSQNRCWSVLFEPSLRSVSLEAPAPYSAFSFLIFAAFLSILSAPLIFLRRFDTSGGANCIGLLRLTHCGLNDIALCTESRRAIGHTGCYSLVGHAEAFDVGKSQRREGSAAMCAAHCRQEPEPYRKLVPFHGKFLCSARQLHRAVPQPCDWRHGSR